VSRSRRPAKRKGLAREANLLYMHGVLLDAPTEVEVAGRVTMAYSTHREATTGANVVHGHSLSFGSALVFVRSVEINPAEFLAQVRDEVMQGR